MFARIGLRVGNMFGKPFQALLRRFAVQYAAEAFGQCVIQLQRTEFARHGRDVVEDAAVFTAYVQPAQAGNVGHGGQIVLKSHFCFL